MFPLIGELHFLESMQIWSGSESHHSTRREETATGCLSLLVYALLSALSDPALSQAPAGKVGAGIQAGLMGVSWAGNTRLRRHCTRKFNNSWNLIKY